MILLQDVFYLKFQASSVDTELYLIGVVLKRLPFRLLSYLAKLALLYHPRETAKWLIIINLL